MDSLRGKFGAFDADDDDVSWGESEDNKELSVDDSPPAPVGQDERRMQVRAYNYWAGLLGERSFPSVEDIEPDTLPDFSENGVLLDFTGGVENPAITFLGAKLAGECGTDATIETLDDVPARSLLSRITDHYMQIHANEAPIGFEAEFINAHGVTILYRGILLPFSTDDETIDFIYGVINWKEVADQLTTDELLLEIDHALDGQPGDRRKDNPVSAKSGRAGGTPSITLWADGPGSLDSDDEQAGDDALPRPSFARLDAHLHDVPANDLAPDDVQDDFASGSEFPGHADEDNAQADLGLQECLAEARRLAEAAQSAEVRSRAALYHAISRAYDVSLAAEREPEAFAALLEEHAIAAPPRAPMTPVVKLVFGSDYDKSRLAEYAAVLAFAHREDIEAGALAGFLANSLGGVKGVVAQERALRRESAATPSPSVARAARTRRKLDKIDGQPLDAIPADGTEYALCVIRRTGEGDIAFLGEVAGDEKLLAKAARNLAG